MLRRTVQQRGLADLRRHLALLIARIRHNCAAAGESGIRKDLEDTCAYAHDLLDKISSMQLMLAQDGDFRPSAIAPLVSGRDGLPGDREAGPNQVPASSTVASALRRTSAATGLTR